MRKRRQDATRKPSHQAPTQRRSLCSSLISSEHEKREKTFSYYTSVCSHWLMNLRNRTHFFSSIRKRITEMSEMWEYLFSTLTLRPIRKLQLHNSGSTNDVVTAAGNAAACYCARYGHTDCACGLLLWRSNVIKGIKPWICSILILLFLYRLYFKVVFLIYTERGSYIQACVATCLPVFLDVCLDFQMNVDSYRWNWRKLKVLLLNIWHARV